jgi:glycosyltransferase involved in cell wall biosynthesis
MISVIIPVYNRAAIIKECLVSVFAQTYEDYEVIVIDDGSTDNLNDVLQPYMSRIRFFRVGNCGAACARNLGLREARGEFIAWLDSDDRWFPFKLEVEKKILDKLPRNVAFVHSDFSCFTDKNVRVAYSYMREYFFTLDTYKLTNDMLYPARGTLREMGIVVDSVPPGTRVYRGDVSGKVILGPMFLTSSILIRRECLTAIGFFDESLRTGEDYALLSRVARKYEVAYLDFPTLDYRRFHSDQLSSQKMELETNKILLKVATELGLNDKEYYRKNTEFVEMRLSHCHYALGLIYYKKKQYDQALKEFASSIKMNFKQKRIYLFIIAAFLRAASNFIGKQGKIIVSQKA